MVWCGVLPRTDPAPSIIMHAAIPTRTHAHTHARSPRSPSTVNCKHARKHHASPPHRSSPRRPAVSALRRPYVPCTMYMVPYPHPPRARAGWRSTVRYGACTHARTPAASPVYRPFPCSSDAWARSRPGGCFWGTYSWLAGRRVSETRTRRACVRTEYMFEL